MKRENYISWDSYFMSVAIISAMRSKDAKTQSGACIADINNKIVGVGYNGLPRNLDDDNSEFWGDDDNNVVKSKHSYVIHAETNAIYNKNLADINGATLYVTLFPCPECAKAIAQNGIKRVIFLHEKNHHIENNTVTKTIFENSNVEYQRFLDLDINDKDFIEKLQELN